MTAKEFLAQYKRQKRHQSKLTLKAYCEQNGRNYDAVKAQRWRSTHAKPKEPIVTQPKKALPTPKSGAKSYTARWQSSAEFWLLKENARKGGAVLGRVDVAGIFYIWNASGYSGKEESLKAAQCAVRRALVYGGQTS